MKPDAPIECVIFTARADPVRITIDYKNMEALDAHLQKCVRTGEIFESMPLKTGLPFRIAGRHISFWLFEEFRPVTKSPGEVLVELHIEFLREQIRQMKSGDDWRSRE